MDRRHGPAPAGLLLLVAALAVSGALPGAGMFEVAGRVLPDGDVPRAAGPLFQDVTAAAGVLNPGAAAPEAFPGPDPSDFPTFTDYLLALDMRGGAAWADVDGDGWQDLTVANNGTLALFRNNGDRTFTERHAAAGLTRTGKWMAVAYGDFDRDRDLDLFATDYLGPDALFRNDGGGNFTDVTAASGIGDVLLSAGATWGDIDGDRDLDLYVGDYSARGNRLWRNQGDGTFADVTSLAGVADRGNTLQVTFADLDLDEDQDLYVVNDFGNDTTYLNRGDGTFAAANNETKTGDIGGGMGLAVGDADGDGWPDLYITNYRPNTYYRNQGDRSWRDLAPSLGLDHRQVGWGAGFLDSENDGDLDLYVVNGYVWRGDQPQEEDLLFVQEANGSFTESGGPAGLADGAIGRGSAAGDFDNDGDLDLYVVNLDSPSRLYENTGASGHWIAADLRGTASDAVGIGARVIVEAGGERHVRQVLAGTGYLGTDSFRVHVGLGNLTAVDRVTVQWPAGSTQTIIAPPVDTVLVVNEIPDLVARAPVELAVAEDTLLSLTGGASSTSNPALSGATFTWFLDGPEGRHTLTQPVATTVLSEPGMVYGTLTVALPSGLADTDHFWVRVGDRSPPEADAGPDVSVDEGTEVIFDGSGSSDNGPDVAEWGRFEWTGTIAGEPIALTGLRAPLRFAVPGRFPFTLTLTDWDGNVDTDTVVVDVADRTPPRVLFAPPGRTVVEDQPVVLRAVVEDNDPDFASTARYRWWFEEAGATVRLTAPEPTYTFRDPGLVNVTLNVTDRSGNAGESHLLLEVRDATAPRIAVPAELTVDEDLELFLPLPVTDNDPAFPLGGEVAWTLQELVWNGTGPPIPGPLLPAWGSPPRYKFADPGEYRWTILAEDAAGNRQANWTAVHVRDRTAPSAAAGGDRHAVEDVPFLLDAGNSTDNDPGRSFPAALNATWTVRHGSNDTVAWTGGGLAVHPLLADPGLYRVTAEVRDRAGNAATDELYVTVHDTTPPHVDAGPDRRVLAGREVRYRAAVVSDNHPAFAAQGNVTWTFREGTSEVRRSGASVKHLFTQPGVYEVRLRVDDPERNFAEDTITVTVEQDWGAVMGRTAPPLFLGILAAVLTALRIRRTRRAPKRGSRRGLSRRRPGARGPAADSEDEE